MISLWSNDPQFYEYLTGDTSVTGMIFTKMTNINTELILKKFNMNKINDNTYMSKTDTHKYICTLGNDSKEVIENIINDTQ